jgi:hypothetical protein
VLYALDSVNALEDIDLLHAFGDSHPQVRRHALRLSESRLDKSATLRSAALPLAADPDPAVQFQAALSFGECRDSAATHALAQILLRDSSSRDISDAVLTSIVDRAGSVLTFLLADDKWAASPSGESTSVAIVGQIARQQRTEDLDALVKLLRVAKAASPAPGRTALIKALSRLPSQAINGSSPPQLTTLRELRQSAARSILAAARNVLRQDNSSVEDRVDAIADLTLDKFDNARPLLETSLSPQEPAAIRAAVLAACAQFDSPEVAKLVLSQWAQYSPGERLQAIELVTTSS